MAGTSRCGTWTARSATAAPSAAANRSARRSRCTEAGRTASRPRLVYHFRSLSSGLTSMPDQASSIALDTRAHALRAAARVAAIEPFHVMEVVKAAAELAKNGVDVISMSVGEPDFTATEGVAEAAIAAIRAGATQYTDALGLGPLRSAIAAHYQRAYGIEIDARRVVVTAGASAGLLLACAAMVGVGDEVLMPDPCYPCNRHFVTAADATPRLLPTSAAGRFQLDATQVREAWTPATRGVLLASPSNPTGTSIAPEVLADMAGFVRGRGGVTVVDEIY